MPVQSNDWVLSAQEAAAAVDGKLELVGAVGLSDTAFKGVGTDTRVDLSGLLFVALVGDAHDAHAYLGSAIEKNASGLMIHRALTALEMEKCQAHAASTGMPIAIILVEDTLVALQKLSKHWRHKCRAMILGITGTNGKTSTKEFVAALLASRFNVQFSKGSFNNHWGVPISLLSIQPSHDIAVIEMGMNHAGELKTLSKVVDADAVVCTMVGRGHLEGVGSIEGAAAAKSEIYEFAPKNATFIFNLDNEHTNRMMSRFAVEGRRTLTFGERAGDVSLRVKSMTSQMLTVDGEIKGVFGSAEIPVFGKHNITNLMTAASLALAAGMSPQEIWKALPECRSAWGRNQWVQLKSGARVLFDGYNANPESMQAALENSQLLLASGADSSSAGDGVAGREFAGRGVAILGEMRELGSFAPALHEELGRHLRDVGFGEVIFTGPSFESVRKGFELSGAVGKTPGKVSPLLKDAATSKAQFLPAYDAKVAADLRGRLGRGDYVLIKGSRGMSLEVFLEALEPLDFKKK